MIQWYKAEFFLVQYWSNHGVQFGQKSGPDWYYAIILNILQSIFHSNWIWFKVMFDEPNEVSVKDLVRNIWNNGIILVRSTFLARLDTTTGPVVYWKELSFIPLYHFYRFDLKNALYMKYIVIIHSGPPICPGTGL